MLINPGYADDTGTLCYANYLYLTFLIFNGIDHE